MIAKISLSPVFPFRFFGLNFILSSISLCVCWPSVLGVPKPNVSFYCNRRSERLGRLHGRSPAGPYPQFGPSGRLRRSVRKCSLSGSRLQPFTHGDLYGDFTSRVGVVPERAKDEGRDAGSRTVAPNLFQSEVLVRWFGQDAPLFHRRSFLGRVFPREGNGEPFSKDLGAAQASRKPSERRALAIL